MDKSLDFEQMKNEFRSRYFEQEYIMVLKCSKQLCHSLQTELIVLFILSFFSNLYAYSIGIGKFTDEN